MRIGTPGWSFLLVLLVLGVIGTSFAVPWLARAPRLAGAVPATAAASVHTMAGMPMSDEVMIEQLHAHFAAHPPHAAVAASAPVDSFIASNYIFNEDGNLGTQIDTAHITQGQTVRFKWLVGVHTVTSGTGSSDPNVGVLFDKPMASAGNMFDFTFNTPGTYYFFCQNHEFLNMKGIVEVTAATPTRAQTWGGLKKTYR